MRHGWVLALGMSVFLVGCADEEAAREPTIQVIELVEHADNETVTDTGAMGDSVGDILTFANPLFDKANANEVGTDQGYCIRVAVGEAW
jgi:allene oxide cyclase